ncbi:hypothetical protein [Trueperella abortisuis]|uniref:Uncharacterized protein n=1 Tax=Trueperella abortisuis TaxID=445930 RepID=A0ABT9PKL9_9ACTO|nr:hypothetical protein [Trueperella abortisuis]MDP9833011.1 hypothetical protein [Trueperella abortisuis]
MTTWLIIFAAVLTILATIKGASTLAFISGVITLAATVVSLMAKRVDRRE